MQHSETVARGVISQRRGCPRSRPALVILIACVLAGTTSGTDALHTGSESTLATAENHLAPQSGSLQRQQAMGTSLLQVTTGRSGTGTRTRTYSTRSLSMLVVFVFVACVWIAEFSLSRFAKSECERQEDEETSFHAANAPQTPYFYALSTMRFLMAWHVVLNNFYCPGEQKTHEANTFVIFARWGFAAVPWFFLVSGFTHTYAKLVGPNADVDEDWFHVMAKKVLAWYPLIISSLAWCAFLQWTCEAEYWSHFLANVLLIHGFVFGKSPGLAMENNWWLCFLMVYLVLWTPLNTVMRGSSNTVFKAVFGVAPALCVPFAVFEWFCPGDGTIQATLAVQYLPGFVFGQALGHWFVKNCMEKTSRKGASPSHAVYAMKDASEMHFLVRYGASLSVVFFGILFFWFSPYDKIRPLWRPGFPLFSKGLLLPFQGVMVASLAGGVDPLAKLLARRPFRVVDQLTLTTFILQWPIYYTLPDRGLNWVFVWTLFGASIAGHFLLERPWRRFLRLRAK
mmetsp:Transcript_22327/g.47574  ORF Transcript_22327/g.47574 Transcript_22327/m.47574 type:complete len:511 (-) Transcript_22327:51-1583(-)